MESTTYSRSVVMVNEIESAAHEPHGGPSTPVEGSLLAMATSARKGDPVNSLGKMGSAHRMETEGFRRIEIPQRVLDRAVEGPIEGNCVEFAVSVNWPELRLTEGQVITNACARAAGQPEPYPDHSIFVVRVPYHEKSLRKMLSAHTVEPR